MYSQFEAIAWITPFGLLFVTAIFVAWCFARHNATSVRVDPTHVDLLIPITIIVGLAGGTALEMLTTADDGIHVRSFAVVGFGAVAMFVYCRIARLPFPRLLDLFALPVMAALMVHRIGCFLAGCCWGDVISHEQGMLQGVQFPPGSFAYEQHLAMGLVEPGAPASLPVYPVQLYEAGLLLVLLLLLWRVPWKRYSPGTFAMIAISSYAFLRFFIEYLRADSPIVLANLTVTQIMCFILLATMVLLPRRKTSAESIDRPG